MDKCEEFLKAVEAERNGEISKDELFAIAKRIASEVHPRFSAEDIEKCAKMMIEFESEMEDNTILIGSADVPAYGESPETSPRNEPIPYINRFYEAFNAAQSGKLDNDELLSIVKKIALESNPGISDKDAAELARISINNANNISMVDTMSEFDLPDGSYTLPGGGVFQIGPPKEKKMEISPETQAKLDNLFARVDELIPPVETVRLKPSRSKTTVFDSKLGGVPYFPKSMEYPTVREGEYAGKPLYFLAQLNFAVLPKLPGFPSEGILQFFAGCDGDDVYGIDFDDGFNQNTFRVIYHESIITDESKLYSKEDMPDFGDEDDPYPFKGEFLLTAEKTDPMGICETDFRFDKVVATAYNELFGGEIIGMWDKNGKGLNQVDVQLYDAVFSRSSFNTRMGGYPFFTQEDPRGYDEEYAKCTVMLFQSDSENGGESGNWDDEICWGDAGVANFFISPEDLEKCDFSHVLYNWDCG